MMQPASLLQQKNRRPNTGQKILFNFQAKLFQDDGKRSAGNNIFQHLVMAFKNIFAGKQWPTATKRHQCADNFLVFIL